MSKILIVDSDMGFVFWLGRILFDAGWEAIPAKDFVEADAWLEDRTAKIDLLIVDRGLAGAVDFLNALRHSRSDMKILIALSEKEEFASDLQFGDITARKPLYMDEAASSLWLRMIEHALGVLKRRSGGIAI